MTQPVLNEDQRDALQEVMNVAMGKAGAALGTLLDAAVSLCVPKITVVSVEEVPALLAKPTDSAEHVTVVRQAFYGTLNGEAILIHSQGSTEVLELLGLDDSADETAEREFLLDVSNLIAGASLNGLAQQLGAELGFSPPSLLAHRVESDKVHVPSSDAWKHALLTEISFSLQEKQFGSKLFVLMPDESMATVRLALDRFLEGL